MGIALNNIGYDIEGAGSVTTLRPILVSTYLKDSSVASYGKLSLDATSSETIDATVISGAVAVACTAAWAEWVAWAA